ncbi:hypothetical protein R1sor_005422 [Riccia sorocarpa]|uniref:Macro domain-containing protein n=1 Tax=Riccia sorocarpa TaxID=122646 RepID=A0ABD3HLH3_9MARC
MHPETGISASGSEGESEADAAVRTWIKKGMYFELTETCKLVLLRGDITEWFVDGLNDAIVNPSNSALSGSGYVEKAIRERAGPGLEIACWKIPVTRGVRCPAGEARITRGFSLPVSRIIHTAPPLYYGNSRVEEELTDAYKNSCSLGVQEGVRYIAFPAMGCGMAGYPVDEAASVTLQAVKEGSVGLHEVHFVLFEQKTYFTWLEEAERTLRKI